MSVLCRHNMFSQTDLPHTCLIQSWRGECRLSPCYESSCCRSKFIMFTSGDLHLFKMVLSSLFTFSLDEWLRWTLWVLTFNDANWQKKIFKVDMSKWTLIFVSTFGQQLFKILLWLWNTQGIANCCCCRLFLAMHGLWAARQQTKNDMAAGQIDRMVMGVGQDEHSAKSATWLRRR